MATKTPRKWTPPKALNWTEDEAACKLVAHDPVAFIIGFLLDQQVKVQMAFRGPLLLKERLGHLDPERIANTDPELLEAAAREKPPIHRYPASMAKRIQQCMEFLVERYDGDAARIWTEATDLHDLRARICELPGFGKMKSITVSAVIARQFKMDFPGWDDGLPPYGSLSRCDSLADLEAYQAAKGAYKKAQKAKAQK
jgi:uncharacterized HhH-GPD family protein